MKKLILMSLMAVFCLSTVSAQKTVVSKKNQKVFDVVEQMPEFPGGEVGLSKYIEENLKYPENAKKDSLSRKVFVQFVINEEGEVENVKIARSVDQTLDKEAIRVVKSMPKWEPAKQFGKPIKFTHTIAVEFK